MRSAIEALNEFAGTAVAGEDAIRRTLEHMAAAGSGVQAAVVLPNAEALSPFEMPRGVAFRVAGDAALRADWLRRKPVAVLAVLELSKLGPKQQQEAFFRSDEVRRVLQEVGAQFSAAPTALAARNDAAGTARDTAHWEAELGPRGLLGVYKNARRAARDRDGFYLAVKCGAGAAADQFYDKWKARACAAAPPRVDDAELQRDQDTLVSFARRSACRMLYQVASALGLAVPVADDAESVFAGSAQFTPPRVARPDHVQVNNALAPAARGAAVHVDNASALLGGGAAQRYNGAARAALVMLGPSDGLALVPLSEAAAAAGAVVPAGTRKQFADDAAAAHAAAFPETVDLRPYLHEGAAAALGAVLTTDRYAEPDAAFYDALERAGALVDSKAMVVLDPVCVKVGNPALPRAASA